MIDSSGFDYLQHKFPNFTVTIKYGDFGYYYEVLSETGFVIEVNYSGTDDVYFLIIRTNDISISLNEDYESLGQVKDAILYNIEKLQVAFSNAKELIGE